MNHGIEEHGRSLQNQGWGPDRDDTFVGTLGPIFTRVVDGLTEVALLTDDRHRNLSNLIHGGVIMTLLDRVMGINSTRTIGTRAPTASITVNFLRPVRVGALLVAKCRLRRVGRGTVFAEGEASSDDTLVATACATFIRPFNT